MGSQNSQNTDVLMPDVSEPSGSSLPVRQSPANHFQPDPEVEHQPKRLFFPWPLYDLVIRVEVRDGRTQGLSDRPNSTAELCVSMLVHEQFDQIALLNIRSHHLSFESFQKLLRECYPELALDLNTDELGWVYQSPLPNRAPQYFGIFNESTFQNAIGVMRNQISMQSDAAGAYLTIHMFAPKHKEAIFRRSRQAPPSTASNIPEHPGSSPDQAANVDQVQNLGEEDPDEDLSGPPSPPQQPTTEVLGYKLTSHLPLRNKT